MLDALLKTKLLIPPIRADIVMRPRLVAKLNDGLGGRLNLISAPAGSGKTTLLASWIQHGNRAGAYGWKFCGVALVMIGAIWLLGNLGLAVTVLWPLFFIGLGLFYLSRASRNHYL